MIVIACLLSFAGAARAGFSDCTGGPTPTANIELISPPYEGFAARLQLTEYYNSAAGIGTANAVVSGNSIAITQTNTISVSPTLTCRTQVLDVGALPAGNYTVNWTTMENFIAGVNQTRTRTLAFTIAPTASIPFTNRSMLLLTALVLSALGLWRLKN